MEERTLEELNSEYKSLAKKVEEIKIELQSAIDAKDAADGKFELASADFTAKKDTYKALEAGLAQVEKSGFSETLVAQMKTEIEAAKKQMDEAELTLKARQKEQEDARSTFERIEGDSKKEGARLDVILVSFGANETINKAISNEIEIDYTEMEEAKKAERAEVDALKTKISEDATVQEKVQELDSLLKSFEELKKNVTPENAAKLAELGTKIKSQRTSIVRRMRTLGVKGGKITSEEVDKMTGEKDAQGRFVIEELERRTAVADKEVKDIQGEKRALLEKLAMSLEIGREAQGKDEEYQKLKAEIDGLTEEKTSLEQANIESQRILADIEKKRAELNKELEALPVVDSAEVKHLQEKRAEIEAEVVEQIDNPKKAELRKKLEELKAQRDAGMAAGEETEEYKAAKAEYEAAVKKLEAEKKRPSVFFAPREDVIIDNPEVAGVKAEISVKEKNFNAIRNTIISRDPELQEADKKLQELVRYEAAKQQEYEAAHTETLNKHWDYVKDYVSEDIYPGLRDENSEQYKAFQDYRNAELELRKAMIALQKDPSEENIAAFAAARQQFSDKEGSLNGLLANTHGYRFIGTQGIHKYLLGKLKDEYDSYEFEFDEAYDINNVERRIAILSSRVGKDGKDGIDALRGTKEELDEVLEGIFNGAEIDEEALADLIASHQANVAAFDDADQARSVLKGTDIDTPNVRFGFIRRIIASFRTPKVEESYNFPANKVPASRDAYEEALNKKAGAEHNLSDVRRDKDAAITEFRKKFDEVATPEEKASLSKKQQEIRALRTKLSGLPERINQTKLAELEAGVKSAESKMKGVPQHNQAVDIAEIDTQITELTSQIDAEPDKVDDEEKLASKDRRLKEMDAMIDEAKMDVDDPRRTEIEALLAGLDVSEKEETQKLDENSSKLARLVDTLREKGGLLAILEVARQKIANLIHIKDANRMLDRRSGRIAEDLVNATRPKREVKEER